MLIVHLITRWLRAGAEENTLQTCMAQRAEGHRVVLVHGREHDLAAVAVVAREIEVVAVDRLIHPISPFGDARTVIDLVRLFRGLKPDVVHTHQSKAGILGRLAARLAGVPTVVHGVHILPWLNVGRLQRSVYLAAERLVAPTTDAFVSVSPAVRDACVACRVGRPERHFVAYSAMDVDRFRHGEPPEDWRAVLGVDEGTDRPVVLLMIAAFERRKRHAALIARLAVRAREGAAGQASPGLADDLRVLFVGAGPGQAAAQKRVREAGLENVVRFAGHRPDPERMIALADVCLLTSEREGLPRVIVQYAAAGKAIVATATPGLDDILVPGESGVVVRTVDEAVDAALALAADPVRRARLAAAAGELDLDRWRPAGAEAEMRAAYAAALTRRGDGARIKGR